MNLNNSMMKVKKMKVLGAMLMTLLACGCAQVQPQSERILTPAVTMPGWLEKVEKDNLHKPISSNEDKIRFVIDLACENVRQGTGGPFGAAIFCIATDELVAVGVNRVVPSGQSWAHAEMTAISRAQTQLNTLNLDGYVLVTSSEPCAMCFGAVPWSGVNVMIYGANKDAAELAGFDEGDKVEDWHDALEKRNVKVIGPLLKDEANRAFEIYGQQGGVIY